MTATECKQLDILIDIAEERDSPLSDWERDFVVSLDHRRRWPLSEKQAECFDRLIANQICNAIEDRNDCIRRALGQLAGGLSFKEPARA